MTDVDEFIENFFETHGEDNILEHAEIKRRYDPVKARAYYLRTRKLKGRRKAAPKRVEEDEVPMNSPSGAKLVDYDGKGPGKATYSDGSTFDGNGWAKPASKAAGASKATRAKRINNAQRKLSQARLRASRIKNARARKLMLSRIAITEKRLKAAKGRIA